MSELPYEIAFVLDSLYGAGFEAYLVGGAVRDRIMGREVHDYDITSSATPDEVKATFADRTVIETGIRHGTVTVLVGTCQVEITTFRTDNAYSDGRHPDGVNYTKSITEDLRRRDFTINAIAYSRKTGYVDPFGGIEDIKNRIIRAVGNPYERFSEDRLRMLRAIRFASTLGFRIDNATKAAIHEGYEALFCVSSERILAEVCKLLCGQGVKPVLSEFSDVITYVIPELKPTLNFNQNNPNHCFDLYEHTVNVVSYVEPQLNLRFSALLHDIGKVKAQTTDDAGISHYAGHQQISSELARTILKRLHASNAFIENVCTIITYHDIRLKPNRVTLKQLMSKIGAQTTEDVLKFQKADILSQSPKYYYRLSNLNKLHDLYVVIVSDGIVLNVRDLNIDGNDLISLGVERGAKIGLILSSLLDDVINEKVENEKEALTVRAKLYIEQ